MYLLVSLLYSSSVFSISSADYEAEISKIIDVEELPAFLGGKQVGPGDDKFCSHKVLFISQLPPPFTVTIHQTCTDQQ